MATVVRMAISGVGESLTKTAPVRSVTIRFLGFQILLRDAHTRTQNLNVVIFLSSQNKERKTEYDNRNRTVGLQDYTPSMT
jgi:hypothetical protein